MARRITSKAQQRYLFAVKAPFAKKFAHRAGEGRPAGSPKSRAAYAALPPRKGIRRR